MRQPLLTITGLLALLLLASSPAAALEWVCHQSDDYCAEINGEYAPEVRFYDTDSHDRMVVDFPSLAVSAVINMKTRKVVTVPRSSLALEPAEDGTFKASVILPAYAPNAALKTEEGQIPRFQLGGAEVHVQKASTCRTSSTAIPDPPMVSDDPAARKCLKQDSRTAQATAGCQRSTFLRNVCDQPVTAVVRSTQHLFSGTIPQIATIVVAPGADTDLGCTWMSGASAPTSYDVLAASFPQKQSSPATAQHGPTKH